MKIRLSGWMAALVVVMAGCGSTDNSPSLDATQQTDPDNSEENVAADPALGAASAGSLGPTATGGSASMPALSAAGGSTASGGLATAAGAEDSAADPAATGAAGASSDPTRYEDVGTNPFVVVSHDPLSTFAADVDTASYDTFRQYLQAGSLPPAESVRLEEYINYFEYAYPDPEADAETPFSISLAAAPTIMDRDTVLLRIGIQGRLPPAEEKKPTNLVFLIDVSGSMTSSEKLPLVQHTLLETLDVLDPSDTVSIVSYASDTRVRLAPTPVSERSTIEAVIVALAAGGSTAGAAGLDLAYQQAEAGFIEAGINHVVLCTDGDFNVGPSSTEELVALIEQKRETGITLTALGYGMANDAMMELVSNAGNGVYGVITDEDQATQYVNERLLSTLVHIAKDVKLQVEFNAAEVHAYRLLGYENRAIADTDFRNDIVDAGEIGAGHRVTAVYELVLAGQEIPAAEGAPAPEEGAAYEGPVEVSSDALVLVKIRYKDVDAAAEDPAYEIASTLSPSDVADSSSSLDADFQWAIAVASFAEILHESPYADVGSLGLIQDLVSRPVHADDPDKAEFVTLLGSAIPMLTP